MKITMFVVCVPPGGGVSAPRVRRVLRVTGSDVHRTTCFYFVHNPLKQQHILHFQKEYIPSLFPFNIDVYDVAIRQYLLCCIILLGYFIFFVAKRLLFFFLYPFFIFGKRKEKCKIFFICGNMF